MTTTQLVAVTATAERTVTYRLRRLCSGGFIESTRPYVASGSSPLHWWLTPSGLSVVTGSRSLRRGESCRPKPMFLAHTAAIASLWTALVIEGPSVGLSLTGWKRDEDGWEDWSTPDRGVIRGRSGRVTPDAVATFSVDGFSIDLFIEVDLATMTQTRLRDKAFRYLTYADSGAWKDKYATCPALLLLTTSEARTTAFLAGVAKLMADHRVVTGDVAPEMLFVSACASVLDMSTAVTERVWRREAKGDDFSFVDLLVPHVEAQRAKIRAAEEAAEQAEYLSPLDTLSRLDWIAMLLRKSSGHKTYAALLCDGLDELVRQLGEMEPEERNDWAMAHRPLMNVLRDWAKEGRRNDSWRSDQRVPMTQAVAGELDVVLQSVLAGQRRRVEAATPRAKELGEPMLGIVLERMANGEVIDNKAIEQIESPRGITELQHYACGDYRIIRDRKLREVEARQNWRERRNFDREAWLENFAAEWLLICPVCKIETPVSHSSSRTCDYCERTNHLISYAEHLGRPGDHPTYLEHKEKLGEAQIRMRQRCW